MANELSKATGRRKTAVAHVRLISGTGKWTVNGVDVERYIPSESLRAYINQPFAMTDLAGKYDVLVSAKGGGIAGRLANQRRAQNLSEQSAKGSFNTEPTGDPEALFEEADYTYTPPSRPEPKAVPYVRPGAQKDMSQRLADAKKADAAQEAKRTAKAEPAPAGDDDEIATESFDDLTEAEIAAYTKRFAKRRADLEKILENDCLLLLSSQTSGAQYKNRSTMWRFVLQLDTLCAAPTASKLIAQWRATLPASYLQRIFDNRAANGEAMKTLILRVRREAKALQERSKNRI